MKEGISVENKKEDLRIVKTKKLLYTTLVELMKEMPFEEIKVSDICNRALVNRSTFYSHYQDKYDLLQEFVKDIKNTLAIELSKNKEVNSVRDYYIEMISIFIDHIEENKDIYKSVVVNNKNSITMDIVYDVMNDDINKHIEEFDEYTNKKIPVDVIVKFYLGAIFNVGIEFLNNNQKYTKDEIIKYIKILIPENLFEKING